MEFKYEVLQFSTRLAILYETCFGFVVAQQTSAVCQWVLSLPCQQGARGEVSRGQEGSGRGDTHSQISLEVTNCQLSLHAARVPGRRPVTVARALRPYAVPCTSAPRGPVCVLQCLPILVACPGREHREPRRDGREHAAVASSVLGPRGLRVNGLGARRGQPQRRRGRT